MHSQARKGMPKSYEEINEKMNQCVEEEFPDHVLNFFSLEKK